MTLQQIFIANLKRIRKERGFSQKDRENRRGSGNIRP
jgi:transcriptional regulator with XRE-family HTH domain